MTEITGIYRFYLGGELIAEQKNALTEAGRSIAIKSLLGIIPNFVNSIAYGVDGTANTFNSASTLITNNSLGFEVGRTEVIGSTFSLSGTNNSLVYSGQIQDPFQYEIHEIAIYPQSNIANTQTIDSEILFTFDANEILTKNGTASSASTEFTASARVGGEVLIVPTGDGTTNYISKSLDSNELSTINTFSSKDLFKLALINTSSTSSAASVYFRFFTDDNSYYTIPFVTQSSSGYSIVSVEKGAATVTGSPTWSSITSLRFWNASTQDVKLDAMKIDVGSYLLDTNFGMISRAPLATPVFKPASIPLTIEYSLVANFNGGS
jgi:hypothetical protein